MIGVTGAAMSSLSFGVSRSIPTLLLSRCIAGALSGNLAVVSSMISEMTDDTNQGKGELARLRMNGFQLNQLPLI